MSKKLSVLSLSVSVIILRIHFTAAQVELDACADADIGSQCILTCKTPNNAQFISFFKLPDSVNAQGACLASGGGCFVLDNSKHSITQNGGITNFIILSHNKSETGMWRCDYGGLFNDVTLKWAKLPTTISSSTGISANSTVNQTSSIPVTVGVGCMYSENAPVVEIQYLPGNASTIMNCTKSATVCSDQDLSAYDCSRTITSADAKCGDTLYKMQLKVSVSNTRNTFQQQLFSPYTVKFDCGGNSCTCTCEDWQSIITALLIVLLIVAGVLFIIYHLPKKGQKQCLIICALLLIQLILVVITIVLVLVLYYYLCCKYSLETVLPSVIFPNCLIVILGAVIVKICRGSNSDIKEGPTTVTQEAVKGENTTLLEDILLAFGNSIYSVTWSFLGKDIPESNDNKYHEGDKDSPGLTITDLTENDAGTYKCIILLKETTNTIRKLFDVELTIIDIVETSIGSSVHLDVECVRVPSFDDCRWSFENNNITPGPKYIVDLSKSPTMTVQNIDVNDAGRYICHVKEKDIVVNSYIFDVVIKVNQEASIGKSTILFKDTLLAFEKSINSVKWSFEGKEIQEGNDKRYGLENNSLKLTITGLTQKDAGIYTCSVWLNDKTNTLPKKLYVELKLIVSQEASIGECITLLQDISLFLDHPIHAAIWSFHGNEIQVQSDKRYNGGHSKSPELTITGLTENDAGSYTCIILLKDKTRIIQKKFGVELKITEQHETTVGLTFTLLKDLKVKKAKSVTWFLNEKELHITSDDRYQGGTKASPALVISDLKDSDAGTYNCTIAQKDKENIWERHYVIQLNVKAKPKELKKGGLELNNITTDM